MQEDDFMANLLSSVTAASNETANRKRKSSPEIPSSDGYQAPSSDGSFFSSRKRYGADSDDEPVWDAKRGVMGKKPRVSDTTITPRRMSRDRNQDNGYSLDDTMDVDDEAVKPEPIDSEEDEEIQVRKARPPTATNKLNGSAGAKRRVINSTSVKNIVKRESTPITVITPKAEPEIEEVQSAKPRVNGKPKAKANAKHWSAIQESLAAFPSNQTSELDTVNAPVGSTKPENVLEEDGSLRFFWLDHLEQDGVVHLVGKVLDKQTGKYVSTCVSVTGIERCLYLKPRAKRFGTSLMLTKVTNFVWLSVVRGFETDLDVSEEDVLDEFESFRSQVGIDQYRCKFVKRKYAFEDKDVEKGESDWLEVVYGFDRESRVRI